MAQRALEVKFITDTTGLSRGVRKASNEFGRMGRRSRELSTGMGGLVTSMGGSERQALAASAAYAKQRQSLGELGRFAKRSTMVLGGLAVAGVGYGLKLNAQWEKNEKSFGTLLGSMERGKRVMEDLRKVSSKSYLRLTDFQEVSKGLIGVGVNARRIVPMMRGVNAAIVAIGGDSEKLNRVTQALGQIQARGKVSAREMQRLAQAGLPVNKILQREFSLTADQVADIGNQGIDADRALKAISDHWTKKYGPGLNESMKTGTAQLDLMKKNAEGFLRVATTGLYNELSKKMLPEFNRELERATDILNSDRLTGGQKLDRLADVFGRTADKIAVWGEKGADGFVKAFDKLMPSLLKVIQPITRGLMRVIPNMIAKLSPVVAKSAAGMAGALVKGFVQAPVLGKLVVGTWLFSKLGGFAAMNAAGIGIGQRIAGGIQTGISTGMATSGALAATGTGSLVAGSAGMMAAGRSLATSLIGSLARAIPIAGAIFGITDVIGKFISDGPMAGLQRAGAAGGGALVGGLLGMVAGPGGAAIGAGLGAALGGPIESVFKKLFGSGGSTTKTLREQLKETGRQLTQGVRGEVASSQNLRQSISREKQARDEQRDAAQRVVRAQRLLNQARSQHGPNSEKARAAEVRYRIALDESRKAEQRARKAERLSGAARRATRIIMQDNVDTAKVRLGQLQQERRRLLRQRDALLESGAGASRLRENQQRLVEINKETRETQVDLSGTIKRAAQQIGPQFAKQLENTTTKTATFRRALGRLPDKFKDLPGPVRTARNAVSRFGRRYEDAVQPLPATTREAFGELIESFRSSKAAVQGEGRPKRKRHGGLVAAFRAGGMVPVALSPGELLKFPDGGASVVPGRPVKRDSVRTSVPAGTKVFTYDGQRRLADGASENRALKQQRPHFASGGVVKPEIVGSTRRGRELANTAIGRLHGAATSRLRDVRERANRVGLGGASGSLAAAMALARSFGLTITSTTGGKHAPSSWHYSGRAFDASNSTGPTPQMMNYFLAAAKRWGSNLLELFYDPAGWYIKNGARVSGAIGGHSNHVHTAMRKGGVAKLAKASKNRMSAPWLRKIKRFTPDQLYTLAAYAGIGDPAWASQVAWGESSYNPRAVGHDLGGTTGLGLWQITTGYNDDVISRFGGRNAMFDPVANARAAAAIYARQGKGAWHGRLGPAGKFDPVFYNRIRFSPEQRKKAGLAVKAQSGRLSALVNRANSSATRTTGAARKRIQFARKRLGDARAARRVGDALGMRRNVKKARRLMVKARQGITARGGGGVTPGVGRRVKLPGWAKDLPEPIQRMLQVPGLSWQDRRGVLDQAVRWAEDTPESEDDIAAQRGIIALERGRKKRARGRFDRISKRLRRAGWSPDRMAKRRQQVQRDRQLLKKNPKNKRARERLKRNRQQLGQWNRLLEGQSDALGTFTESDAAIRDARQNIRDARERGEGQEAADLAEQMRQLTEELRKQREDRERATAVDESTLKRALIDMLNGELAGRVGPVSTPFMAGVSY